LVHWHVWPPRIRFDVHWPIGSCAGERAGTGERGAQVSASRERFAALARRLGALGEPGSVGDALLTAYGEPHRTYHGLAHLMDCLARLDEASAPEPVRDQVEAALWYHDAVYDPRADDNEERSAERACRELPELGVPSTVVAEIARLVRLTNHRTPPEDHSGRLICDIDLSILGRPSEEFDVYDAAIRAEYAWVPEERYRDARRRILQGFLNRDPLYQTEHFRRRYEGQARANLRRAVAGLAARKP
jgi:predicted metal-dependent HD superfamily phosphohydrolase